MYGLKKSPIKGVSKFNSPDPRFPVNARSNPFDSDDELDNKQTLKTSGKASSERSLLASKLSTNPFDDDEVKSISTSKPNLSSGAKNKYKNDFSDLGGLEKTLKTSGKASSERSLLTSDLSTNPFDDDEVKGTSISKPNLSSGAKNKYKNDFSDSGGLENQTVEELENYAVHKAEETTKSVNACLKIAEGIREDATKTLVTLHQQGEQITRTHMVAADMEQDLSRGEKLLGSLGGIFSKTWKPKKTRSIMGPVITRDDPVQRKGNHLEQRERLGLTSATKERTPTRTPPPEPTNALQKVEVEKVKQDDALSDLSNILGELKDMAIDMGSEIDRQNKGLNHVQDDVEELNFRVKGANQRTRHLLGK